MGLLNKMSEAVKHISLEPVFFLYCGNMGLISISTQGLYLNKACLVNLNYTQEVCSNIHNQTEIQKETQRFVSEIQAYNGMLQSAPAIVFTLFAGPLSDTYGRKPLIISALFGYFVLNIFFLVNSIWFFELKVTSMHTIMERDVRRMFRLNTCFLSVWKTWQEEPSASTLPATPTWWTSPHQKQEQEGSPFWTVSCPLDSL